MEHDQIPSNGRSHFSKLAMAFSSGAVAIIALFILVACNASSDREKSQGPILPASNVADDPPITGTVTVVPVTLTPIPTDTAQVIYRPTPDPLGKERFATAVAESDNEISTRVALTHAPTVTPGPPPIYPTETPVMGLSTHCANANSHNDQCYNFWRGRINGEIWQVVAGSEGSDGNISQGLVRVWNWNTRQIETYLTPQILGPVEIVSENNLQFTLAVVSTPWTIATPGTTLVFDLPTRQWITP